ncbi:glycosyltransferase family 4 protein [Devosia sp. Root635]|uniref:glycosyltransferase family 4 protein n=1 Tax=Devosia sp. Root635 TaxID=1736575 RepID=UPI0006FD3C6A|nr:glycosyltransferase family 4 protein [Devosia sp. Root635]KRA45698.1 hypothetical protein ASD80_05070 [Devosia sp. Root635]
MTRSPAIHFVCVTPPPVTGMTNVSAAMAIRLAEKYPVVGYRINRPEGISNRRWSATKHVRLIAGAMQAALRARNGDYVYMTPDSGNGLIGSLIMLAMLRIMGRQVVMHHHVFSYLNETSLVSRLFFRIARHGVRHIVLCGRMGELMQSRYGGGFEVVVQSNAALVGAAASRPERLALRTIGYLSNITTDKGIDTFLATAEQLADRYPDLKVLIAGPAASEAVRGLVEQFVAKNTKNRQYLGPVYGADKAKFFEQVDVLLFPTRYKNEAEPLVIFEAARAGTLVIASDRGCICEQIADRDLVVPDADDFVQRAAGRVGTWIDDPAAFATAWRTTESMRTPPDLPALPIG